MLTALFPPGMVATAPRTLPGPLELPGLGSPDFILRYSIQSAPLGPILLDYRKEFGDIFTIKTGPIRQVWVADEAMVDEIYGMEACSGRSQLPAAETPFGEKFLFLMREPAKAQAIRKSQQKWLSENAGGREVRAAVAAMEPELFAAIDNAMALGSKDGTGGAVWPATKLGTAILGALLGIFVGDDVDTCLSMTERAELLSSLAGYRKRANAPPNPFATKLDYAKQVRSLLLESLTRSGRTENECVELLPLLVSACVGGGEIFLLLLQWTVRRLALEPELQGTIRAEIAASNRPYGSSLPRILAAVMRQCPYSLAIGPPRKALTDFTFRGLAIPEGSLVFAMHPGVGRQGALPPLKKSSSDEKGEESALRMFGVGSRSCTAAETSLAFMCSALSALICRYEITVNDMDGADESRLLRYKSDGSLLVPEVEVLLNFRRLPQED